MLYAIYACENIYGGLHGIDAHDIVDCRDRNEADEIGLEMSLEVMESYDCVMDSLKSDASEEYEEDTSEWCDYLEDLKMENTSYSVYCITDTKGKSDRELEREFWNDKEEFIKNYCQE